jgi:hypothetical protein
MHIQWAQGKGHGVEGDKRITGTAHNVLRSVSEVKIPFLGLAVAAYVSHPCSASQEDREWIPGVEMN